MTTTTTIKTTGQTTPAPSKRSTMKTRLAGYLATLAPSKLRVTGPTSEVAAQRFARYYLRSIGGGWIGLPEGGSVAQGAAALWDALAAQGWAKSEDGARWFVIAAPELPAVQVDQTAVQVAPEQTPAAPVPSMDSTPAPAPSTATQEIDPAQMDSLLRQCKPLDPAAGRAAQQIGAMIDDALQVGEAVHTVPAAPPLPPVPPLPRTLRPVCAAVADELRRNGRPECAAALMDAPQTSTLTTPRTIAAKVGRSSSELRELRRDGKAALSLTMTTLSSLASGAPLPERRSIEREQPERIERPKAAQRQRERDWKSATWWRGVERTLSAVLERNVGDDELETVFLTMFAEGDDIGVIGKMIGVVDPDAYALCKFAWEEALRRNLIDEGTTLSDWLVSAAFERAHYLVTVGVMAYKDAACFRAQSTTKAIDGKDRCFHLEVV